jgi:polar amino acid transport system substrate-binding protein
MKKTLLAFASNRCATALLALLLPGAASAACNVTYEVQVNDNLFTIAEKFLGNRQSWTTIYYANQAVMVGTSVVAGTSLYIPCAAVAKPEPEPAPLRQDTAELKLLTGNNFAPFTGEDLPGQGMLTEIMNAAIELAPSAVSYSLTWENDWSQHLYPLLDTKAFDVGFPWVKPDCEATPKPESCIKFHYSDSLMTIPVMLFVRADKEFPFADDSDILGKSICRPEGYFTHDLDRSDRNWLADKKITLIKADTSEACLQKVLDGEVDALSIDLFSGASSMLKLGVRGTIIPLERPMSEETMHAVISKQHARGTTHLYRVNAGIKKLKQDGRYQEIISRHLEQFWTQIN